jgi:hypothetical protein
MRTAAEPRKDAGLERIPIGPYSLDFHQWILEQRLRPEASDNAAAPAACDEKVGNTNSAKFFAHALEEIDRRCGQYW